MCSVGDPSVEYVGRASVAAPHGCVIVRISVGKVLEYLVIR